VKVTLTVILLLLVIFMAFSVQAQETPIDVYDADGDNIGTLKAIDNQGTQYIFIEDVSKLFGGTRQNQPLLGRVTLIMKEKRIVVSLDRTQVKLNDTEYNLSKPPIKISGKIAVPIDFLTKILTRTLGKRVTLNLDEGYLELTDKPFDKQAEFQADLGVTSKAYQTKIRIMIDPGHGGFDPGAKSKTGITEKELTLQVAQKMKEIIEAKGTVEVYLTRNEDRYMTQEERVNFANNLRGNVLISLHFNWSPSQNSKGFCLFTNSDRIRISATGNVATSSADMFIGKSKRLANEIRSRLSTVISTGGSDKEAPLSIMNGLFMPGVLVEILYLSNQKDLDILSGSSFIDSVAKSLSESVLAFSSAVLGASSTN
jgi:N-acetylmuramoyl-L-alanine amidase